MSLDTMEDDIKISGEIIIHTSQGDLRVGLFCKEMPLSCRSFIEMSLNGDYDEEEVEYIIPDYLVQIGSNKNDKEFAVERNSRLRFVSRGYLGKVI